MKSTVGNRTAMSGVVYESLKDNILHLDLPPGTAVNEIESAERYGMSRTPVRDAFKALQNEGLLEIIPHVGTFVTKIDISKVSDSLYLRTATEQAVLLDLCNMLDSMHTVRIGMVLQKQEQLLKSDLPPEKLSREFIRLDDGFHYALFAATGKGSLISILGKTDSHYRRFRMLIDRENRENISRLHSQHRRIFELVQAKNRTELYLLVYEHINECFASSPAVIEKYADYFVGI